MSNSSKIFKKALLAFVFLFLFFPIIQNNLNLFLVKELNGSFEKAQHLDFSFEYWMNSVFQETQEKYLNECFGLRSNFVRINNQFRYNFFKKSSNKEVVFGKNDYLFGDIYMQAYTGKNYVGIEEIKGKCLLIKELQDNLKAQGKVFLPIIAPNKIRGLIDFLPEGSYIKNASNYDVYIKLFKKFNIKYIDFNSYFITANQKSEFPLFTKYGIHWSTYGHTLAADSIINYLNYNYVLNTPTMIWKNKVILSDSLRDFDYDIGLGMNLFVNQLRSEKVGYPIVSYKNIKNNKPSLLVIGDSFNSGLEKTDYQNQAFSDYKFLYYFKEVIPYTKDALAFYKLNLKDEINNHKVILLVTSDNMRDYGWGFLEKAVGLLNGKLSEKDFEYENNMHIMEKEVKDNYTWFEKVKNEALMIHVNLDFLVHTNAKYEIDRKRIKSQLSEKVKIEQLKADIMKDSMCVAVVNAKAIYRGISRDSMLTIVLGGCLITKIN